VNAGFGETIPAKNPQNLNCYGIMYLEDFTIFGLSWVSEPGEGEWNRFCDISIPSDKYIDWRGLDVFVDNRLACK